ncbi:UbiA prenyltransferase family protein [archaeon]|nr:UbiA prenyltransferase family protein [archaeon]MBT5423428.1 UbiA prenyltransferase family protein [archaeon]
MKQIIKLVRVRQWYKNLVIFLPIVFAKELFNLFALYQTILGFISLSFISSANYIINDIIDKEKDKKHYSKKYRPIAAGQIKIGEGIVLALIFLGLSLFISYFFLTTAFIFFVLSLFFLTQIYTFFLKNEPFIDILLISVNFVIRSISGAFVILNQKGPYVKVSPWIILCPFFLAFFLAVNKRRAEYFLTKNRTKHRKVLNYYTESLTSSLQIISTTLLVISYALYTFFSPYPNLIFTLPFVLYIILIVFGEFEQNPESAMKPQSFLLNLRVLTSLFFIGLITFVSIYFL